MRRGNIFDSRNIGRTPKIVERENRRLSNRVLERISFQRREEILFVDPRYSKIYPTRDEFESDITENRETDDSTRRTARTNVFQRFIKLTGSRLKEEKYYLYPKTLSHCASSCVSLPPTERKKTERGGKKSKNMVFFFFFRNAPLRRKDWIGKEL